MFRLGEVAQGKRTTSMRERTTSMLFSSPPRFSRSNIDSNDAISLDDPSILIIIMSHASDDLQAGGTSKASASDCLYK
jgi:hypothetical protein